MRLISFLLLWIAVLQVANADIPDIARPAYVQMCTLRGLEIMKKPESVVQIGGTCGMTSLVSLMGEHAPVKLMTLNEKIYSNEIVLRTLDGFVTNMESADQFSRDWEKCDFILARGQMELLRETSQGELLYKSAMKFSEEFAGWTTTFMNGARGDLALKEDHIEALMLYHGAKPTIAQSKDGDKVQDGFIPKWYEQINKCVSDRSVCPEPVVMAAVNGYSRMTWGDVLMTPYKKKSGDPRFSHWIILKDEIVLKDGIYTITTWSWSKRSQVRIHQAVIDTYFIVGVYGSFDKK